MSLRTARTLTAIYFTAALVAVTWPGIVPFARIRPFVLGLPFSMAWIVRGEMRARCASSLCVHPRACRAARIRFIGGLPGPCSGFRRV